jgi:hypothetical protein
MSYFVTDVESDGQIIGKHSIVCFGVVKLTPELDTAFYGQMKPISDQWIPDALAISGFSRKEHNTFPEPEYVMKTFADWLKKHSVGKPILISDNNGYDASWINYYFHVYYGSNPFGWSSRRIGDLYCGMVKDSRAAWKHLRKTTHSHIPTDDAKGNAEALLEMIKMGLKMDAK